MVSRSKRKERRSVTFPHITWWFSRPRMSFSGEAEREELRERKKLREREREKEREKERKIER
jgi:hypothetical protein